MAGTARSLRLGQDTTASRTACRSAHPAQRGAVAIVLAMMMVVLLAFIGMSLDLGRVYNRRIELQAFANIAALAAARQLNGTPDGVTNALTEAANAVKVLKYQYNQQSIGWSDAALWFSTSSTGGWIDAAAAKAAPDGLMFVQADTSRLGDAAAVIDLSFMRVLSDALASTSVSARAVAGRSSINVAPLAVCALSNTAATPRVNPGPGNTELVEYGFRRGVAYNLMQLNPNGTSAEHFVIDPFDPPGVAGAAGNTATALVGPYACTGQLAMPRITGAPITVGRPFPLASLFNQLNSRFDQYAGSLCSFVSAPPDTNVKSYVFGAGTPWMNTAPSGQGAAMSTIDSKLWTVADPPSAPGTTAAMYGPLWTYARAVPYSAYVPGTPEPAAGYTPYATSVWANLYTPGSPTATASYPSGVSTPYKATNGTFFQPPSAAHKGVANRRVLNVALLSCPVAAGTTTTATVLGIGKFLMTVPATSTSLYAEFGGLASEQALGGAVELYP